MGVGAASPHGAPHYGTRRSLSCVPDLPRAGTVQQLRAAVVEVLGIVLPGAKVEEDTREQRSRGEVCSIGWTHL